MDDDGPPCLRCAKALGDWDGAVNTCVHLGHEKCPLCAKMKHHCDPVGDIAE